jgi:MYXO-CTERM domain-containing protein
MRTRWFVLTTLLVVSRPASAAPCGDGVLDSDEACDLGIGNEAGAACTPLCQVAVCGDGLTSPLEACDDGNLQPGDGCGSACQDETAPQWLHTNAAEPFTPKRGADLIQAGDSFYALFTEGDAWFRDTDLVAYDSEGMQWRERLLAVPGHPWARRGSIAALATTPSQLYLVGHYAMTWEDSLGLVMGRGLGGAELGETTIEEVERLTAVQVAPNGDLLLGGVQGNASLDVWYGRLDVAADALVWSTPLPRSGDADEVLDLAYDGAEGLFALDHQGLIRTVGRLDPNTGAFVWRTEVEAPDAASNARPQALARGDDRLVVAGWGQAESGTNALRGWMNAYDLSGAPLWQRAYPPPDDASNFFHAVAAMPGGGFTAVGQVDRQKLAVPSGTDLDGIIVSVDPDGVVTRSVTWDGRPHLSDSLFSVLATDPDHVVVGGTTTDTLSSDTGGIASFRLPDVAPLRHTAAPAGQLRRLSSPDACTPEAHRSTTPPPAAHRTTPRSATLYLEFGGGRLSPGTEGRLGQSPCIDGPFDYPGFSGSRSSAAAIAQTVRDRLAPLDVQVVWEQRPPPGLPYTTVMVGGRAEQLGFSTSTAGYTCAIDCEDSSPNDLVFVFESSGAYLAETIVHEAAHSWGLDHVLPADALMSPFSPGASLMFAEGCVPVSDVTSPVRCGESHAAFCPPGQQDAVAELLARFGPRRVDSTEPEILGVPDDDLDVDLGAPIALSLAVLDDSHNAGLELRVPALGVTRPLPTGERDLEFHLPEGSHTVELVAYDHAHNVTIRTFDVHVRPGQTGSSGEIGSESGDSVGDESETDEASHDQGTSDGCACGVTQDEPPGWLLMLAVVGLWRRRY